MWQDGILKFDWLSAVHNPWTTILSTKSFILHPLNWNFHFLTSILHLQLYYHHPQSKVQDIWLKMSSKLRVFWQNVRKRRLDSVENYSFQPQFFIFNSTPTILNQKYRIFDSKCPQNSVISDKMSASATCSFFQVWGVWGGILRPPQRNEWWDGLRPHTSLENSYRDDYRAHTHKNWIKMSKIE